ncbi:alpha-aminoadipate reductase Lys1p [Lobosporangium transversale]|uniref:Alpha-aminoadipate reductase n=1 Tax=Lobosporangium transversale TaxID=64571 RepID=A0A1Y2G714_9FUNG|nr:alpha-aminoadipate reductase Lys1p [Lobosporangium transversale]ORY99593.1 alpha-aminoadipate reductase Lys1p [Lobosporangium transversale]|eukprot:XP_021875888.1 alpha-aminoadipate reductase Lys1p [Lobosporangium transversale]
MPPAATSVLPAQEPPTTETHNSAVALKDRLSRWKTRLEALTEIHLPTDYPRPIPLQVVEAVHSLQLTEQASLSLLQASMAIMASGAQTPASSAALTHASPFTILLAAFAILLHRYTGDEDMSIGSSSESRNPVVLRLGVSPNQTFREVVEQTQLTEKDATNDEVPFTSLLAHLFPNTADTLHQQQQHQQQTTPSLFRVRFFNELDRPSDHVLNSTSATTDLTITVISHASSSLRFGLLPDIELKVSYNQVLFSSKRIQHILDQLVQVLNIAGPRPDILVSDIDIVTPTCREVLPNPSADLYWSSWPGAIHDIFARNAKAFPNRECVFERRDVLAQDGSGRVLGQQKYVFTFGQLHEASNLVAHALVKGGIEPEDVVMVYAYRGVDLVIAVMAVLKAGATFSVIDPAYPPTRQKVYLSVARPRGLIVLAHAGILDASVRSYIEEGEDFQLKCEIPGLQITSDGQVLGGQTSQGVDVLDAVRSLAAQDVGVVVGPDSIGTLSFTSGSTGIPKGVRGRHFSLTHYYTWMQQEFGLSSEDRFTMLSGIAHDPIQRDIFTPLFLGAQLHIPTTEDIGIPGQLAVWMQNSAVTVTHLTPAMGQLLTSHAQNPVPSLKNAFFVGDILTKRDVHRLQKIAANCRTINMYGTTETQRAVSYYSIPAIAIEPLFLSSEKDVMPAGRGMLNVQLLVINRVSRKLCGIGEVGEIYVRAGGLAEGYLRLEEATQEKFLANWLGENLAAPGAEESNGKPEWNGHWKGRRDRLYRTGDLGRYRPDGNVECSGRADDQVKIRGFRIELGEIDTHLSQHPLVRENVTLVRRDKNEEQTLVSYFIPVAPSGDEIFMSSADEGDDKDGGSERKRRYRRLIRDIREWLKVKLPAYSVPSVFVPLTRMPLTPNGKVDKNALPFPDTPQFNFNSSTSGPTSSADASSAPSNAPAMNPTQLAIHNIWKQLLPSTPTYIPLTENFFDIGGHSILATRLIFEVRRVCCVDVPLNLVFREPTIGGMAKEVARVSLDTLQIDVDQPQDEDNNNTAEEEEKEFDYSGDLEALLTTEIQDAYLRVERPDPVNYQTFFLTGATGFLGAFILRNLLTQHPTSRVICLVRASTSEKAMDRVRSCGLAHLIWDEAWVESGRLSVVMGDLSQDQFGLSNEDWDKCCRQVDVIVHNGALVHWVYPYPKLRAANVLGTLQGLKMASTHHTKSFHFVSSTSVLDTAHYTELSDVRADSDRRGVYESDDLEGARYGLRSGYGQSKWVAEKLIMAANAKGLPVTIIRPGYVLGHTRTGVTNTDDFIWRLIKGCIELGQVPNINNAVNLCPVDYVAQCVTSVATTAGSEQEMVYHVTHPIAPPFRFNDFFQLLIKFGYDVQMTEYIAWRTALMEYTLKSQDSALYPLLHLVMDDLPTSTKSPELDDSHTQKIVIQNSANNGSEFSTTPRMDTEQIGIYLAYMIKVGFLDRPTRSGDETLALPEIKEDVRIIERSRA